MTQRPIEILLVEDSPADLWLIRETLKRGATAKNISVVANGEQAIDFIRARPPYNNAPRPDIVLLDLNLPRRDGLEVLREIKSDPILKTITVIVLTTSEAAIDVNTAYDLNANCYVVKPIELEKFTLAIRGIEEFWMRMASLPSYTPQPGTATPPDNTEKGASADSGRNPKRRPATHVVYKRRARRLQRRRVFQCAIRNSRRSGTRR